MKFKNNTSVNVFYCNLNLKAVSKDKLKHVLKVIKAFNIKTLIEHHGLYLSIEMYDLSDYSIIIFK